MKPQVKGQNKPLVKNNTLNKKSPKDRYDPSNILCKEEFQDSEYVYPGLLSNQKNMNTRAQLNQEVPETSKKIPVHRRDTSLSMSCRANSPTKNSRGNSNTKSRGSSNLSPEIIPENPRYSHRTISKASDKKICETEKAVKLSPIVENNFQKKAPKNENIPDNKSNSKNEVTEQNADSQENFLLEIPFLNGKSPNSAKSVEMAYVGNNKFILKNPANYSVLQKTISYFLYKHSNYEQEDQYPNYVKSQQKSLKDDLTNLEKNLDLGPKTFKNLTISNCMSNVDKTLANINRINESLKQGNEKHYKLSEIQERPYSEYYYNTNKFDLMKSQFKLKSNRDKYNKAEKTFQVLNQSLNSKIQEAALILKDEASNTHDSKWTYTYYTEDYQVMYAKNREYIIKNLLSRLQQNAIINQKVGMNKLTTNAAIKSMFNKYHDFWNILMNANKKWTNKINYSMRILKNFRRLKGSVEFEPSSVRNSYKTDRNPMSDRDLNFNLEKQSEKDDLSKNKYPVEIKLANKKKRANKENEISPDSPQKVTNASCNNIDSKLPSPNFREPEPQNKIDEKISVKKQKPNRKKKLNVKLTDACLSNSERINSETYLISSDVSGTLNIW